MPCCITEATAGKLAGQGNANLTKPNGSANVGIQGDLWQAKPDTGSALE